MKKSEKIIVLLHTIYHQYRRSNKNCSFYDCKNQINQLMPKFGMSNQNFLICDECYKKYKK
jgi:hypothetical protein